MTSATYNIPFHLFPEYTGRPVIVRSTDPEEIVRCLAGHDISAVQYVQVSADADPEAISLLANWDPPVAVDIVLSDPVNEFPLLYKFSKIIDRCPVRVSIPVTTGFFKAVKLALALQFSVKLVVGQPDAAVIDEMSEVLEHYLHRPNVEQPVDYFHSLFLSEYREERSNMWLVQEDDPELFRFVGDDGVETASPRFGSLDPMSEGATPTNGCRECDTCEFLSTCGGYFKWPDPQYSCDGVKRIFTTINEAAAELRKDVASLNAMQGASS